MPVTLRRQDGTAAVYNTVEEALDQASYDEESGYGKMRDVVDGSHDDASVEGLTVVARRSDLTAHRKAWKERWGIAAGVVMTRAEADRILAQEKSS